MGKRRVGVQRDALLELELRRRPFPIEPQLDVAERDMRFSERWIELDRFQRGRFRLGNRLHIEGSQGQIGIGEASVRQRILGLISFPWMLTAQFARGVPVKIPNN